jgi:hypothetical protein
MPTYDFGAVRVATFALLTFTALLGSRSCGVVTAKFSGHAVIFRSSPTVFGDGWMPGSTSTRILSGKPPRATWSAAMFLGLYRMSAPSYRPLNAENSLQHLHPVGERWAKRLHRHQAVRHHAARLCKNGLANKVSIVDKKSSECIAPAAPSAVCVPLINPSRGHASGRNDARIHGDLGDCLSRRSRVQAPSGASAARYSARQTLDASDRGVSCDAIAEGALQ